MVKGFSFRSYKLDKPESRYFLNGLNLQDIIEKRNYMNINYTD